MITYTSVFIEYSKKGIKAMKKNNVKKTGRIVRSCFAALLAVVMAIPVAALSNIASAPISESVEVEAADVELPDPIMSLDFERGFKGEAEENGLKVKESKERLMFEEYTNENDAYVRDENGKYIFEWTDVPVIYGSGENLYYAKGTFGNQPTTYDDPEKGNVLRLDDSMEAEWIIKTESDKADSIVPVYTGGFDETTGLPLDMEAAKASTLQIEHTAHSAVQINNPFAGMDFTEDGEITEEGLQWTKGVTISYWVKVPTVEPEEGEEVDEDEILNDSVLFTFENIQRPEDVDQYTLDPDGEKVVYEVNGYIKYEAAKAYDPEDPMYAQGTLTTVTDIQTKEEYEVLSDYGPLVRLTPDYPGSADRKIYYIDEESQKVADKVINIIEDGKPKTVNLYELGPNIYKDFCTLDTKEGSLVARGYINGSMQIAASNTFHFKEDDFYQKQEIDASGQIINTPVNGAFDINPNNTEEIGKYRQFRHYNMLYFEGDGTVTEYADEWHYVTCVIQNDWVQFYVDGEEIEADSYGYHGEAFSGTLNAKKYFNKAYGMRYPYGNYTKSEWSEDGTLSNGPSNCVAQTMLEWISNPDTVLYIGYEGVCAEGTAQQIGTLDGALLDDITFYDVPLTSEQATVLYEQAKVDKDAQANKEVKPIKVFDFDSEKLDTLPSYMTALDTNATSTRTPKVVNDEKFGHVFKFGEGKSTKTSAVSFENPFKGMSELEGATISYWVKTYANEKGKVGDGVVLSIMDEPKILEHGKIQEASKNLKSRTALFSMLSYDAEFMAAVDTKVYESLKNNYKQTTKKNGNTKVGEVGYDEEAAKLEDEWNARIQSLTDWHYVTMVVKNSGITMYMDGVKHSNNQIDNYDCPSFYGPRFYDGYYNKVYDNFSHIRLGTGNQTATSVMEFLTQEDTTAYLGFVYTLGSNTTYRSSALTTIDDVAFYDKALSDAEVEMIYSDAKSAAASKTAVAGEEVYDPYPDEEETEEPVPTNSPEDVKEESDFTEVDGKLTATANGVTVTGDKASIPANAKLVVNKLGETASKERYEAAEKALNGAGITVSSYNRVLYDIHLEVDGKTVAPTGTLTITIAPPTGYQAAKTTIVRMSDVKSMTTSVSGSSLKYETETLGEFALLQKKSTTGTNPSTEGSSTAGKTGDTASVVVPVMLLVVAFVVVAALRKKEELMED